MNLSVCFLSECLRIVEVRPFAYNLTELGVAYRTEIGEVDIVAYVEVSQHRVEAYIESLELVVAYVHSLKERKVAEIKVGEVIPFEVYESQGRHIADRERSKIVVGSEDIVEGFAVVDGELGHMVVVAGQGYKRGEFLDIELLDSVALYVEVLQFGEPCESHSREVIVACIECLECLTVGDCKLFKIVAHAVEVSQVDGVCHIKVDNLVGSDVELLQKRSSRDVDFRKTVAVKFQNLEPLAFDTD